MSLSRHDLAFSWNFRKQKSGGGPKAAPKRAKHLSLRGIIQVHVTKGAWLRAQASIKERGFGIRDPVLLASSSSTASLCNSLRSEFHDTHNPT